MSEIINETINELNKPTQNNVFSIEDNPVTVLEKINQVERYLKQIDTRVDTSINTANEALEKANNAFEANGTLVKINGANQLTWSADFAESERQKSKNLFPFGNVNGTKQVQRFISLPAGTYTLSTIATSSDADANTCLVGVYNNTDEWIGGGALTRGTRQSITFSLAQSSFSILFFASNNQSNSEGDTFSFADIQIEEGSVATDYQQYNGAIVHEKDIEPVLIYDIDTKNTINGTAYTNGVKFGTSININVAGYSNINVYTRVYNTYNITEVVIDKTGWTGNSFMVFGEASAIKNVGILIYLGGQNITPAECYNFSDVINLNNNDNAYIYRIEGVK